MKEPLPYKLADEIMSRLVRQTATRLIRAKRKMLIADFDELNVIDTIDTLYEELDGDNRRCFYELFRDRYIEMWIYLYESVFNSSSSPARERPPNRTGRRRISLRKPYGSGLTDLPDGLTEDALLDVMEMQMARILTEPNVLTGYTYETEVLRKRDRAKEAVIAAVGGKRKQETLGKHASYWTTQTAFYIDIISDTAAQQAMEDFGAEYVKWNTQRDEKVCQECKSRNGAIYRIDKVPDKPHLRCRCWLSPVRKSG